MEVFKKNNVLVVGDVMLDHYIHGQVTRQSPEADVPVVDQQSEDFRAGGAANVALNIKGLGGRPYLVGVCGSDTFGKKLKEILHKNGLEDQYVMEDSDRVTTCKTRIIADEQHIARVDHENQHDLSEHMMNTLLSQVLKILDNQSIDVAILQDYNKGVFTAPLIKYLTTILQERNIPFVIDPKKKHFLSYKHAGIFKPNLKELQQASGLKFENKEELVTYIHQLRNEIQCDLLMVTLGSEGLMVLSSEELIQLKAQNVPSPDVCGAGDAVISLSALAYANSIELSTLAMLANDAGALACKSIGVNPIRHQDLF